MSSLRETVYRALSTIPKGQVITYEELARRIGATICHTGGGNFGREESGANHGPMS